MSIHDHIPKGYVPRAVQTDYLNWLEKHWDEFDVAIVNAPTAVGKSLVNIATGQWRVHHGEKVALMAPRKNLQDQITNEFGWIPCLKGMSNYVCDTCMYSGATCRAVKQLQGRVCSDQCKYVRARAEAENASMALFNFHSYFVNGMYKDVAIIDEGHGAVDLLYSLFGRHLWKCELGYPDDIDLTANGIATYIGDVIQNLTDRLAMLLQSRAAVEMIEQLQSEIEGFELLRQGLLTCGADFIIKKKKDVYYGQATQFRKTEQEYIYVKTTRIDTLAEKILWPRDKVSKVIMTSATIGKEDVELLGLANGRRVMYYGCDSIIPDDNRPFVIDPVASMSYKNRAESYPKIAKKIHEIAAVHKGQKGVVHCTYDVARELKSRLGEGGRYMFHDNTNKDAMLRLFLESKGDKILIASGMAEGIDLKDDLARFQVLVMLQFPSLADEVMQWMANTHPMRYKWLAVRTLIQQAGRIVRHPEDWGVTYFIGAELDKRFFYETKALWPQWFSRVMCWTQG